MTYESNLTTQATGATYVFILCPRYCGSTILRKLIETADNASATPPATHVEGIGPELLNDRWNPNKKIDWNLVEKHLSNFSAAEKPFGWRKESLFWIEKTPFFLLHAKDISRHFAKSKFIVMVRNPYAFYEGLCRRKSFNMVRAAKHVAQIMRTQMNNLKGLENAIGFRYEDLVEKPDIVSAKIENHLRGISKLDYTQSFEANSIDGKAPRKLFNFNDKKIKNLSQLSIMINNDVLKKNRDLMEYWGYDLISTKNFPKYFVLLYYSMRPFIFFNEKCLIDNILIVRLILGRLGRTFARASH